MKSIVHILALESRFFEALLEKRDDCEDCGEGVVPGALMFVYMRLLPDRKLTLDCPREEVLVDPPPSYIFVMNEDLYGVYPTPNGVYIRKPLERGEEVMVLHPGYQGTNTAVHHYHESQLFVLCEDNSRMIQYDLTQQTSSTHSVLGLPVDNDNAELAWDNPLVFFMSGAGRLFCLDMQSAKDDTLQAKPIWSIPSSLSHKGSYSLFKCLPGEPEKPHLMVVYTAYLGEVVTFYLELNTPDEPLIEHGSEVESMGISLPPSIAFIIPFNVGLFGFAMRRYDRDTYSLSFTSDSHRTDRTLDIGKDLPTRQSLQLVYGAKDVIHIMRQDPSLAYPTHASSDKDGDTTIDEGGKRRCINQTPCWISTHYIYI